MTKEMTEFNDDGIEEISLLHEDIGTVLSLLPSLGWQDLKIQPQIQNAQVMISQLQTLFQQYIDTRKHYRQRLTHLKNLLEEAQVSECVDDLVSVRRNIRRNEHEKLQYRLKLKKLKKLV